MKEPLMKTSTDREGRFVISGSLKTDTFDPSLRINHKCRSKICTRKVVLPIPSKYRNEGTVVREFYDLGIIDMKRKFVTESKMCPT
ncbi:unnamed protein product [Thelazia callipaeda]|uniref:Transthyretin-like family protein n=1 Tax=Thelazia callipaeda TaxID=103827 RepID=A0A0N5CTC9_THECL|nr:unnamed protein product [Thelazia callipaeda]